MRESAEFSSTRQVLVEEQLDMNGLLLFGHQVVPRAGQPMRTHCHEGAMEFVLVLKGEESYHVAGRQYDLSGGDVFLTFPDEPHRSSKPFQDMNEIIWFQICPTVQGQFLGLSEQYAGPLRERLIKQRQRVIHVGNSCLELARKCFDAFVMGREFCYCAALFYHLLAELLWNIEQPPQQEEDIQCALMYVEEHLFQPITMQELCQASGLSLSGFKHKFKQVTGRTPRDYVNSKKVLAAQKLLKEGVGVTETAMRLGFNSGDYFSVVFKRHTALTPLEYRQKG